MKYVDYMRRALSSASFPIFSISDLRIALKDKKISKGYLYLLLHNLLKNKEIARITKGIYSFHADVAVVGFAFRPFYYGLESALSIMGISGQGTNLVVITSRNVRLGNRVFGGRNYRVLRIKPKFMFGYVTYKYGDFWVPASDLEKTLIDMLYFKVRINPDLCKDIRGRINPKRFLKYVARYDPEFRRTAISKLKELRIL